MYYLIALVMMWFAVFNQVAIIGVIHENLQAYRVEDIDRVMETVDPDSPVYDSTRSVTLQLFSGYDLSYELKDIHLIFYDGETAEVEFVQVTKKINGAEFRNNRVAGVNFLRKTDSGWKIYSTIISSVEYLDSNHGYES